jgi:hypothetical protein
MVLLELKRTFYVSSSSRNLISVSRIIPFDVLLRFQKLSFYFINLIVLKMIFCLMVSITLIYKTMSFIVQYVFTLELKDVLLIKVSLCYDIGD